MKVCWLCPLYYPDLFLHLTARCECRATSAEKPEACARALAKSQRIAERLTLAKAEGR